MHTHRIDKYLDTLLANQTAGKAMPPTVCQKGSAQDGEAVIGYAEAGRRRSPMCHHHHHIYSLQNTISTSIQNAEAGCQRSTNTHQCWPPLQLRDIGLIQVHKCTKNIKKEEKHSQYTSQQQFNNSAVT